jgi:glucose-6-phosphate isomerase
MNQSAMHYAHDVSKCLAGSIGERGVSPAELDGALGKAEAALRQVRQWHEHGTLPLLSLPERRDDLPACQEAAQVLLRGAADVVIFGTGGSSLGAQTLAQLAGYRVPGVAAGANPAVRFHFFDNLDGSTLELALKSLDLGATRFLAVSKSGGTPETIVQMVVALEALAAAGLDAAAHMVALTEPGAPEKNAVRRLASRHKLMVLDHDPGVGGRYSVLSNVGLLPGILAGLDPVAVRQGAGEVLRQVTGGAGASDVPPALGAAVVFALTRHHGLNGVIMMPYADRLRLFSAWFAQLWAESLGKNGEGTQPIAAAGPVDQHSQLQLFLDGPADKLPTLILPSSAGQGPRVPESYRDDPLIGYLAGHAVGDLTDAQGRATAESFARNGRPVRTFSIERLDERTLGALLMHFMLETIIMGLMLDVDPFDQPAVEQSKVLTREYLASM